MTGTAAPSYRSGEKAGQQRDVQGVNDKVYTLAKLYNLPADFCLVKFFQAGYGVNRLSGKPPASRALSDLSARLFAYLCQPTLL